VALSNRDRIGRAFDLLGTGLRPYVARRLRTALGEDWERLSAEAAGHDGLAVVDDPAFVLRALGEYWDSQFRTELARSDRNLVIELHETRQNWAANQPFSFDDTYRTLDSIERLLASVDSGGSDDVGKMKVELRRLHDDAAARKVALTVSPDISTQAPSNGLPPWRMIAQPHDDVAKGRFALAEFAADLHQVHRKNGAAEYIDPLEFFRRTYLTDGLRQLLQGAVRRVSGAGGDPVVELQTNFGGGKTHSMIALYHLLSGRSISEYPQDVQDLVTEVGLGNLPNVQRAVLVGTKLTPGQPRVTEDGVQIRTMWGELAWQLGGRAAYDLVAGADETSTNPGDALRQVFELVGPCLILIDEWVAYARQLYADDTLKAGTFDTHFSFAQALTEAARATPGCLLVVSIPASESADGAGDRQGSDIEVGGSGGREALRRLRNVIGRMESAWRPASADESFEIVRRRLFQPIDPSLLPQRDFVAKAFGDFYRSQAAEFPAECRNPEYVDKLRRAYPIHPELFARLYEDWSTLDRFQRTRGVLRLMANVVHSLWESGDQSPMILPGLVPLAEPTVSSELTRNLEDAWKPILDTDIDGPFSTAVEVDNAFKNLGRHNAARRVARSVFLATAPRVGSTNRGVDSQRVRLACALPGDTVATFGDALSRLSDRATYFYVEGGRCWFGTQPGVGRLARDRATRYREQAIAEVQADIVRRLRVNETDRGHFAGVHIAPTTSADVADSAEVRLVILGPDRPHTSKSENSPALLIARDILDNRGAAGRSYRNMLVFLGADSRKLDDLYSGVAEWLAWESIGREAKELGLDLQQAAQATTRSIEADRTVGTRLADAYQVLLVPIQDDSGSGPIEFRTLRADGSSSLAARAADKLTDEGVLSTVWASVMLRLRLDGVLAPMWENSSVTVAEIWDALARYVYLPRLKGIEVLLTTVRNGPAQLAWESESFATADAYDAGTGRYLGLTARAHPVAVTTSTLLVAPAVAAAQFAESLRAESPEPGGMFGPSSGPGPAVSVSEVGRSPQPRAVTKVYGTVHLDSDRLNRDFGRVVQEVIAHLTSVPGTSVRVTVELSAENPAGLPESTTSIVSENAKSLRFDVLDVE
jgi:predicted AAA+ superfamily ATPase